MAKKRQNRSGRKSAKGQSTSQGSAAKGRRSRKQRKWPGIRSLMVIASLGVASVVGASMYKGHLEELADLSVIGNGVPTVVQVHDPGCSMCRELMSNTKDALRGRGDSIQYRVADIATPTGRAFAAEHQVRHVTLVTFSSKGKVVKKLNGVRKSSEIKPYLDDLVKAK